jgi:hypothetical protein
MSIHTNQPPFVYVGLIRGAYACGTGYLGKSKALIPGMGRTSAYDQEG